MKKCIFLLTISFLLSFYEAHPQTNLGLCLHWIDMTKPSNEMLPMQTSNHVSNSHPKYIRIGGEDINSYNGNTADYVDFIKNALELTNSWNINENVIVSIPFDNWTVENFDQFLQSCLNHSVTLNYISIGNEPNLDGYDQAIIDNYKSKFTSFVKALKNRVEFNNTKIVGPDVTVRSNSFFGDRDIDIWINSLLTDFEFYQYIDIFSFHYYPFHYENEINWSLDNIRLNPYKESIYSGITYRSFKDQLLQITGLVNNANSIKISNSLAPMEIAITETNILSQNPVTSDKVYDNADGISTKSIFAAFWWGKIIGICNENNIKFINFWCISEGSGSQALRSMGYLSQWYETPQYSPFPTYHVFKMFSDNLQPNFVESNINSDSIFCSASQSMSDDKYVVFIINEYPDKDFQIKFINTKENTGIVNDELITYINAKTTFPVNLLVKRNSILMISFDDKGALIGKTNYSLENAKKCDLPVFVKDQNSVGNINDNLYLFPNPAKEKIFLLGENLSKPIEIYTLEGIRLIETRITESIDITKLPNGVFILKSGNKKRLFVKLN